MPGLFNINITNQKDTIDHLLKKDANFLDSLELRHGGQKQSNINPEAVEKPNRSPKLMSMLGN